MGSNSHALARFSRSSNFNPRSPCGERPWRLDARVRVRQISIHAPRVGSDEGQARNARQHDISIHAPRVGSDATALSRRGRAFHFNPRSPRGSDAGHGVWIRATTRCSGAWNFNPRSLCGERRSALSNATASSEFQSTLHVRGATSRSRFSALPRLFQSTLPVRGATRDPHDVVRQRHISIHAPCAGSDFASRILSAHAASFQSTLPVRGATAFVSWLQDGQTDFNPRSPRGERPAKNQERGKHMHFNPRSPRGERRDSRGVCAEHGGISIHAPRVGSDYVDVPLVHIGHISIHAPRVGSDSPPDRRPTPAGYFNPRSPRGERRRRSHMVGKEGHFNPRSPRGERL